MKIMEGNTIIVLIMVVLIGHATSNSQQLNDLELAKDRLFDATEKALGTVNYWARSFTNEVISLEAVASSKESYTGRLKSEMGIIRRTSMVRFAASLYDINKRLDKEIDGKLTALKNYLEINSKKLTSYKELEDLFLAVGKTSAEFADHLSDFNDYFMYWQLIKRGLDINLKFRARIWFILNRAVLGDWAKSVDIGKDPWAKDCQTELAANKTMVETMIKGKTPGVFEKLQKYKKALDECYVQVKSSEISTYFIYELKNDVIAFAENITTDNIPADLAPIKEFVQRIADADVRLTDTLTHELTSSINRITLRSGCLRTKLRNIEILLRECESGRGNFEKLLRDFRIHENHLSNRCLQGKPLKKEILKNVTVNIMTLRKAQTICMRNNIDKKKLVCTYFNQYYTLPDIMGEVDDVTYEDIEYFSKVCLPGSVINDIEQMICKYKFEGRSISNVTQSLNRTNKTQVEIAYNACQLSAYQKKLICDLKAVFISLEEAQKKIPQYPSEEVKTVYDECPKPEMSPNDKSSICLYKQVNVTMEDPEKASIWMPLFDRYGKENVKEYYDSCPKKESDVERFNYYYNY